MLAADFPVLMTSNSFWSLERPLMTLPSLSLVSVVTLVNEDIGHVAPDWTLDLLKDTGNKSGVLAFHWKRLQLFFV